MGHLTSRQSSPSTSKREIEALNPPASYPGGSRIVVSFSLDSSPMLQVGELPLSKHYGLLPGACFNHTDHPPLPPCRGKLGEARVGGLPEPDRELEKPCLRSDTHAGRKLRLVPDGPGAQTE